MIGDLLHRLDLHGGVEPVDDVGRRLRHGAGQPLENFGTVRNHRHIAKAAVAYLPKGMKGAIPDCPLVGAGGHEIAGRRHRLARRGCIGPQRAQSCALIWDRRCGHRFPPLTGTSER